MQTLFDHHYSILVSVFSYLFPTFQNLQTTQQKHDRHSPLVSRGDVKAPDERYGSDDIGKIDQQIQHIGKNVDRLHIEAVPLDRLVPRPIDWRAG